MFIHNLFYFSFVVSFLMNFFPFSSDEPQVYVTVRATDNGRPALDDVCTFKVTIEDINDNPPVFDKVKYEQSIPADTHVGKVVIGITSYDFDDGDNSIIKYELLPEKDYQYFRIDENNGLVYLTKPIDRRSGQFYNLIVRASNIVPDFPQDAQTDIRIKIIESNKKPPIFLDVPSSPIFLKENFTDYSQSLVTLRAMSNVPDKPGVIFELITGRTEQTNSKKTFVFNQSDDTATISLGKSLDYEAITEYTLTMSVRNTWDLNAEVIIKIKVEDVNDNIPYFTEVTSGSILENEPPGTPVMQVRAFDMDGTSVNNIVSFELADNTEYFTIDPVTGNITALTTFDREERDYYNVKVIATDNSPSSLYNTGQHNKGQQVFRIEIADKNDHPPHFEKGEYVVTNLREDVNKNFKVVEVKAVDDDDASQIFYTIVSGNIDDAFKIDGITGAIIVNQILDYENITDYSLRVRAFDGIYEDYTTVKIFLENINDNPPVFMQEKYSATIDEEKVIEGCILTVEAYDPDIKDRTLPQNITYGIVKIEQQSLLKIDNSGCLRLILPLDRDAPDGHKQWQVLISAADENGKGLPTSTEAVITLNDINDNAPFITNKQPVVWYENQQPGNIVKLTADDYDEPKNGAPFSYDIDSNASDDIKSKFSVTNDYLVALDVYDREAQKEYFIPIMVSDSGYPRQKNVSILHLIIGDINDNPMKEGHSNIFVYNFKGQVPDTEIGRVYVDDPDDWDLPDKTFTWKDGSVDHRFSLSRDGMITLREGTMSGTYELQFYVTEESRDVPEHSVVADVTVTVKEIPEEAVDKSGSIRFHGITAEDFVEVPRDGSHNGLSLKDRFHHSLARLMNTSIENVDVFTVLKSENDSVIDVRFSAHGSPYYESERLNGKVALNQKSLEKELGIRMMMINIDECLIEKLKCEASCTNVLHKSNVPQQVYTNTTSFVGVNAFVQAECACAAPAPLNCLNGGTPFDTTCECLDGFEGPHCEIIGVGFYGDGYAMYPPINPCEQMKISLDVTPAMDKGLVLYIGPMAYNPLLPVSDFLALELVRGYPVLTVDYGTGTTRIEHKHIQFTPGKSHHIEIILQKSNIEMTVDDCRLSSCMSLGAPEGPNEFLNVNAPLQLGGAAADLRQLSSRFNWSHVPQSGGYHGCIRNLTVDGHTYNIGAPSLAKNADPGCQRSVAVAVSFQFSSTFLLIILACLAVLLLLVLAFVVQKRRSDGWNEKDMDDIRETIINYEDEGGGERDTDYDLNVLRSPPIYEDKVYAKEHMLRQEPHEVPDIGGFLVDKKESCDKDTDAHPLDDVRHYAYEGDGNSSRSSLSSLASCTDDGDLRFDYLSNFGPRFRKLADMYGEEPSDVDSNGDADEGWRI